MPQPIISAKHLSKEYVISHRPSYGTLRDSLADLVSKPFRKHNSTKDSEHFWALKDINFSVQPGERIGIIGRNGAGKSTILKIFSQITSPTSGNITLRGRVASLLEVGTGFHPELTGRENVFLNGAILGMKQAEIRMKFDEIVAFAEIEKFLDTPVKRYSSGMYVRLAFAVAAHLDSDILLVDEVLAVGDAEFQNKCLGKIKSVSQQGRTILFISHNMASVAQVCERTLLLTKGELAEDGKTTNVISNYLHALNKSGSSVSLASTQLRMNSDTPTSLRFSAITIKNSQGQPTDTISYQEPFSLEISVRTERGATDTRLGFAINSPLGFPLYNSFQIESDLSNMIPPGEHTYVANVPNNLGPGLYEVGLGALGNGVYDLIPSALQFNVLSVGNNPKIRWENYKGGIIHQPITWTTK